MPPIEGAGENGEQREPGAENPGAQPETKKPLSFTQEEFNKIVTERVERAKNSALDSVKDKILDDDSLKAFRDWQKNQQDAEDKRKRDEGKFDEMLADLTATKDKEITDLKSSLEAERTGRNQERIQNEILKYAGQVSVAPEDVVLHLVRENIVRYSETDKRFYVFSGNEDQPVKYRESDGKPAEVKDAIDALLKAKPYLAKSDLKPGTGSTGSLFDSPPTENLRGQDRIKAGLKRKK